MVFGVLFSHTTRQREIKGQQVAYKFIEDQIYQGHAYYNQCIFVERHRRRAYRRLVNTIPVLKPYRAREAAIQEQLNRCYDQINEEKIRQRSKQVTLPLVDAAITNLKKQLNKARNERKEKESLCLPQHPLVVAALTRVKEYAKHRSVELFDACRANGLGWHTANLYQKAIKQACSAKGLPKYRRWSGEGCIGIQLPESRHHEHNKILTKGGVRVADLFGTCKEVTIHEPDESRAFCRRPPVVCDLLYGFGMEHTGKAKRRRQQYKLELLVRLHRELPPEGVVTQIRIARVKDGRRFSHKIIFTVVQKPPATSVKTSIVAFDLGWRYNPKTNTLTVATTVDTNGNTHRFEVPSSILAAHTQLDELHRQRSILLDDLKQQLKTWSETTPPTPAWQQFLEDVNKLQKSRSQRRFVQLIYRWRDEYFVHNDEIFKSLEMWRQNDIRLFQHEARLTRRVVEHRKKLAYEFIKGMCRLHDELVFEDIDISQLAKRDNPSQRNRSIGAPGEFRELAMSVCHREGRRYRTVSAVNTTVTCHICGKKNNKRRWPDPAAQIFTCQYCGARWDRDINGATNVLFRACDEQNIPRPALRLLDSSAPVRVISPRPEIKQLAVKHTQNNKALAKQFATL